MSSHAGASCTHLLQHTLNCPLAAAVTSDSSFTRRQIPSSHVSGDLWWRPGWLMVFFPLLSIPGVVPARGEGGKADLAVCCVRQVTREERDFPPFLTRPLSPRVVPMGFTPADPPRKQNKWMDQRMQSCRCVATGTDWYAAECVSEVCRGVEPQTATLPPLAAVIVLFLFFLGLVFFFAFLLSSPPPR